MKDNSDSIRQENKKALPKFILMGVGGIILGLVLGIALVFLGFEDFAGTLSAAGASFTINIAPWLLMALPILELALCLPIYFGANKRITAWDGEDEAVSGEIEARLSVGIWITGMANVLDFFLVAAQFSGFVEMEGNTMRTAPVIFFGGLGAFLVTLYVTAVLQQKLVDATKKMNPEKHGSVYDTKFQKKWLESCDEAERAVIGQCALKAYQAVAITCLVLWAVLTLGGMFFSWGFMPAMTVCVIWGVSQSVYCYWAIRLSKPGAAL
ncbi:MAG: DUF3169 family protein [Oscillospiraceae bacterium]|nr:DUF3169 family protein [Oscillospiraceae bacterium]